MTTPRDIDSYGGVFSDAEVVKDPTTEISSSYDNRLHEDVAQMTRTTDGAAVKFVTDTGAAPLTVAAANVLVRAHSGTGSASKPVVTKSATGVYALTFTTPFEDGLEEDEAISFFAADATPLANSTGYARCTVAANVINVFVFSSGDVPSDLAGLTIYVTAK